jgi:hypothetical protein
MLGQTPMGLLSTRACFDRRGRVACKNDLLIRGLADHDIQLTRGGIRAASRRRLRAGTRNPTR